MDKLITQVKWKKKIKELKAIEESIQEVLGHFKFINNDNVNNFPK